MKFSNVLTLGLAAFAAATPIEKRDLPTVSGITSSITSSAGNFASTQSAVFNDFENLFQKLISDFEAIAAAYGADASAVLAKYGINASKREDTQNIEARDFSAAEVAIATFITDNLAALASLGTTAGIDFANVAATFFGA